MTFQYATIPMHSYDSIPYLRSARLNRLRRKLSRPVRPKGVTHVTMNTENKKSEALPLDVTGQMCRVWT